MRRIWMVCALLAAFCLGFLAVGRLTPARPVSIRQLWMNHESWVGRRVGVSGKLEIFNAGGADEHLALEEAGFRVGVRGADAHDLSGRVGRGMYAEGRFGFSERFGGYIQIERWSPR